MNVPALELGGITLGLREGVIALIVFVALYMMVVVWRMRRLKAAARASQPAPPVAPSVSVVDEDADDDAPLTLSDVAGTPTAAREEIPAAYERPSPHLAESVLQQGLERELQMLRDEVDAVRGELAALRADMHRELGHLRATQSVAPIYGDAMQMAMGGHDAAMIAERCGIARAEAELVVALARSQGH